MATIESAGKVIELKNGDIIRPACEELDIPFGCRSGFCGTCKIEVLEGADNLSELTQEETEMGDRNQEHRLACQTKIISGNVKIKAESF